MKDTAPSQLSPPTTASLLERVRSEYLEMPGLRLTLPQAQRLFGLGVVDCAMVLETLTRENFLCRGLDGRFAQ
jgi:hypothetical protein